MAKKGANRKKKRRAILWTVLVVILLITIAGYFIAKNLYQKWEARFDSNTSMVFLLDDGGVVSNDVIHFDTGRYSALELEQFIEETIASYNKEHGDGTIEKKSLVVENNIATLILIYKDSAVYEDFTGTELFHGTIAEAVAEGYSFDKTFAKIVDGKAFECQISEFLEQTDLKVAIIRANTKVQIDGEIVCISAENVIGYGKNWIATKDGGNLFEIAGETETGTTVLPSETEDADISVDGTEDLTEEESGTDIIFDFGDTQLPTEKEETYSEVYTYIIYR